LNTTSADEISREVPLIPFVLNQTELSVLTLVVYPSLLLGALAGAIR
jgi:hypothetical protein